MMNENYKAYLQFKILGYRFQQPTADGGHGIDQTLALFESGAFRQPETGDSFEAEDIDRALRLVNVCAKIPRFIFQRLEANLEVLTMSKREFIEIAIVAALEESEKIMAKNGVSIPEYDVPDDEVSE